MRAPVPRSAAIAAVLSLAAACVPASQSPEEVARGFWSAIEASDFEGARALSTAPSERRLHALFGQRIFQDVSFAETLTNEDSALVETALAGPEGAPTIAFNTHLVRFDDGWRVDPEPTAADLRRAAFAAALSDVQESLREGQRVLSEALEQGARDASEALRRAIEDLDRALGAPPPGGATPGEP